MKRQLWAIIIGTVLLVPTSAQSSQTVYPTDSDLFAALSFITVEQGKSIPSSSGPWTAAEMRAMLKRVNRATLSPNGRDLYDYIQDRLTAEHDYLLSQTFSLSLTPAAVFETYFHTAAEEQGTFTEEEDWIFGREQRNPPVSLELEFSAGESLYGCSELSAEKLPYLNSQSTSEVYNHLLSTNIFYLPLSQPAAVNIGTAARALVSVGDEHWNIQIGRGSINWGSGRTGNLLIGGHISSHDYLKFTAFHDTVKLTSLLITLPHPLNLGYASPYLDTEEDNGEPFLIDADEKLSGTRIFAAHRAELRILDVINLSLSAGLMHMSEDGSADLSIFNPLLPPDDCAARANTNVIRSVEIEITPSNRISLYGQAVIDELLLPWETTPSLRYPDAVGFLIGAGALRPYAKGYLYAGIEAALTDPYLYLYGTGGTAQERDEYGVNFVVGRREYLGGNTAVVTEEFLGYRYGNDVFVADITGGYREFGRLHIEGNIRYLVQGTHDRHTLWEPGYIDDPDSTLHASSPTSEPASSNRFPAAEARDAPAHIISAGIGGSCSVNPRLKIYGRADAVLQIHAENLRSSAPAFDFQAAAGVAWKL